MTAALKVLPSSFRKMIVKQLTPVFTEAVDIVTEPLKKPDVKQVLIQNRFVGINASDINVSAGRYHKKEAPLPFTVGFEGVGEIASIGEGIDDLKIGQPVMYLAGAPISFAEYVYLPHADVIPIQAAKSNFIPLLVSGLTASLSLDKCGRIAPGDKVLITAAAGGTGHIAVQWAKNIGCHVIGLCSSKEKVQFLKDIGCDCPINYKTENLSAILKSEYPNGVDVIWESIGGEVFDTLFQHLSIKGRLIVLGVISNYRDKEAELTSRVNTADMPMQLLRKSTTISGFFLNHFGKDVAHYLTLLVRLMHEQKLNVHVDTGELSPGGVFKGLDDIIRAVEHLHSGKNIGKVVVEL